MQFLTHGALCEIEVVHTTLIWPSKVLYNQKESCGIIVLALKRLFSNVLLIFTKVFLKTDMSL
jgi:hypothetical protein